MTNNRWKQAQEAEIDHHTHAGVDSEDRAVHIIENGFSISIDELENKAILAVGCGTGVIHNLPAEVPKVGIDTLTGTNFETSTTALSSAELITAAGENIPFESETFDVVICRNVLDHTKKPSQVIDEIHRVMTSDGMLLFNLNIFNLPSIVNRRLGSIDTPHPHHYNEESLLNLMSSAGFKPEIRKRWSGSGSNLKTWAAYNIFRMEKLNIICEKQ